MGVLRLVPSRRTWLPAIPRSLRGGFALGLLGLLTACGGAPAQQDPSSFAEPAGPPTEYILWVEMPSGRPGPPMAVRGGECLVAVKSAGVPGIVRCPPVPPTQVILHNNNIFPTITGTFSREGATSYAQTLGPGEFVAFDAMR